MIRIPFGKHEGRRYGDLHQIDPGYAEWVLLQTRASQTSPSAQMKHLGAYLALERAFQQAHRKDMQTKFQDILGIVSRTVEQEVDADSETRQDPAAMKTYAEMNASSSSSRPEAEPKGRIQVMKDLQVVLAELESLPETTQDTVKLIADLRSHVVQ